MKILTSTSSSPAPEPHPKKSSEGHERVIKEFDAQSIDEIRTETSQAIAQLAEDMDRLKNTVAEMRSAKPAVEVPPPDNPMVMQMLATATRQIDGLTSELATVRQMVEVMKAPVQEKKSEKKADEKPANPPPPATGSTTRNTFLERMGGSTPSEPGERKVAFLTKLWDYLNAVAIDVPLRK